MASLKCKQKLCSFSEDKNSNRYNFLSPIPVSDWQIVSSGNSILHQKKEIKMRKTQIF